jgi:hypothetical protein
LLEDILKQFTQHLFNKLTKFEVKNLYLVTGVSTKGDFVKKLTNSDSLQTLLDGDLLTLKKQINALISMIEVNTNAVHANTIATDNLTLAMMANTHARTVANSANFVSDSSAFFKQQDAFVDKRKWRVV